MIKGKGTLSYKKKNVAGQKIPHTGVKNIVFAHEFTNVGEDAILFNSLNEPLEWTQSGLSNPSATSLLSAHLEVFKANVEVKSSARGSILKTEYVVKNNGIYFKNITSLANEIFEVKVSDILVAGNTIVDMRKIRVEGELLDTTTDFVIGYELDVIDEEIVVFRDGAQMFRSDNNESSGTTGNYYYLDGDGDGKASSIRFFEAASGDEGILIASTGGIVDSPNISTFQQIETLAGQIDSMIPTLAALAEVDETEFQLAPNNVDLKNFGDKVAEIDRKIDTGSETVTEYVETATKTKIQTKILQTTVSASGNIFTFNNLEVGKIYRYTGQFKCNGLDDASTATINIANGAQILPQLFIYDRGPGSSFNSSDILTTSKVFTATSTTLTFDFVEAGTCQVTQTDSFIDLEELPNHEETTQWT